MASSRASLRKKGGRTKENAIFFRIEFLLDAIERVVAHTAKA
jgi:hypothetical protein